MVRHEYPPGERDKRSLTLTCEYSLVVSALARVHLSPRVWLCSFTSSFATAAVSAGVVVVVTAEHSRRRTSPWNRVTMMLMMTTTTTTHRTDRDRVQERSPRARTRGASSFAADTKTRANLGCPLGGCVRKRVRACVTTPRAHRLTCLSCGVAYAAQALLRT